MHPSTIPTADGDIAFETAGERGPLVLCLPGMGDLRSAYRHLTPRLVEAGLRVATIDLPGHGDSTAGAEPSQRRIAEHAVAIARELGGPAIAVGHSYTPDAALLATRLAPDLVRGAVGIAPWAAPPAQRGVGVAIARLVAGSPMLWGAFYRHLHRRPPADLDEHVARIRSALRRPGGAVTPVRMAGGAGKDAIGSRAGTTAPTIVIMGERDPDFRDPRAEAEAFAASFGGEVRMIPDAGHYPHAESPDAVAAIVAELAERAAIRA